MAVDAKKMAELKAALDKKYWTWAWNYFEQQVNKWTSSSKIKAALNSWTYNNSKNYTPYTSVTWKNVVSWPSMNNWKTDYVKDAGYWRGSSNWDKNANVETNASREDEAAYHFWQDAKTNAQLFTNRADFNKYYKYDEASPTQKKMYDEMRQNYNKYWLSSTENFYADNASQASTDKNTAKMKQAAQTYTQSLWELNKIRQKLDDRLWPVFDQLKSFQARYLNDMSELRKLQNDYYAGMKREYDALAAGQSASVGSTLSGQWLSQSAIASTIDWVDKAWQSRYNDLMWKHIETLKWLQDSEQNFMTNYWTLMWNLSNVEQNALKDWYSSFVTLRNNLDSQYGTLLDEKYNPYEVLTQAKVSWASESGKQDSTKRTLETNYKTADEDTRINYLRSYLKSYFWDEAAADKYVNYLRAAAKNSNDLTWAFEYLAKVTWNKKLASVPSTVNPTNNNNNNNINDIVLNY